VQHVPQESKAEQKIIKRNEEQSAKVAEGREKKRIYDRFPVELGGRELALSLCPLGLASKEEGDRVGIDMSSWVPFVKKSSSSSYGDDEALIHWPRTSPSLEASSGLNEHSVPFSACNLKSSLSDLFPLLPLLGVASTSASPFAGKATEFRGVCVACVSESFSINDRSQSSLCEPLECKESWDMENSTEVSKLCE
jgi:hypothetical protein